MSSGIMEFSDIEIETNTEALVEELSEVEKYSLSTSLENSPTTVPPTPGRKETPVLEGATESVFRRLTFSREEQSVAPQRRNKQTIAHTVPPRKETRTSCAVQQRAVNAGTSNLQPYDGGIVEILCEVKKTNKQLLEYGERLGTLERRMASIEQSTTHGTPSSSCSDTVKTKVSPPPPPPPPPQFGCVVFSCFY